jgi:two-component system sensor histidine kinase RegB
VNSTDFYNNAATTLSGEVKHNSFGRLRLRTLVSLRWLAIVGQVIAVAFVGLKLGYDLPLAACFTAIASSAWLNIILTFSFPSQRMMKHWEAAFQLIFDISQLGYLLYLTGGTNNPFIILFVAPATIAAATLSARWVIAIISITLAWVATIYLWHLPLPWVSNNMFEMPTMYELGFVTATWIGVLFTSAYAWRVASEEMRLANALVATQTILAQEQKLAALGSLAAAAAHELGTPLATIQLTAKELTRELSEGPTKDDVKLIFDQSLRCRDILRDLSAHSATSDPTVEHLPIGQLLREAVERHDKNNDKAILFEIHPPTNETELIVIRRPEILYGIGNFIENGMSFAKSKLTIKCKWDAKLLDLTITDDGPGFDPDILPRLGEPYITSRGQGTSGAQLREGMGLGFFIAKTLIERVGGEVRFGNQISPDQGAIVRIIWSRDDIEHREMVRDRVGG